VGALPSSIAYALFRTIADYSYQRNGKSVQRMRANYRIIQPHSTPEQLEQLIQLGMRSYMRYWCDTFRIHTWNRTYIEQTVSLSHDELLRNPMNQGRGVIIALPHSGNWDHAGAYFCGQGFPLVTVAEVLKPEKLFQKFLSYREKMGFEVLPLGSRTFITLMRKARDKRLIALVADRDLSDSGVEVIFFGHRAKMPAGPALLAIKEGLPLVVAHVSYTSSGIHINFTEIPISDAPFESDRIQETVQRCADAFAVGISAHPEDWHMLQRIWIEEGIYS
jgi:KDO2-lipid IV(A) lauroyltransferase